MVFIRNTLCPAEYIDPAYNFKIAGKDFCLFTGFTPFTDYYSQKFAFVNAGITFSDSFEVSPKLELPVELTFCINPSTRQAWFIAGIGIRNKK